MYEPMPAQSFTQRPAATVASTTPESPWRELASPRPPATPPAAVPQQPIALGEVADEDRALVAEFGAFEPVRSVPAAPTPSPIPLTTAPGPVPVTRVPAIQPIVEAPEPVSPQPIVTAHQPQSRAEEKEAPETQTTPEPASKPEWMEMLAAIREDIEKLRTDNAGQRREPVRAEPALAADLRRLEAAREEPGAPDSRRNLSRPVPPAPKSDKSRKKKKRKGSVAVQDQCGFAALLAKLDEITENEDAGTSA